MDYFRKPPDYFLDWSLHKKYLIFEMANNNPSVKDVRSYYDKQHAKESVKVKDEDLIESAKEEFGIDLNEFNDAIDKGEFNF